MELKATIVGFSAILMWSLLALFTSITQGIPPFQLLFLTFSVGGCSGLVVLLLMDRNGLKVFRQPIKVWLIGVGGLFGYHFLYFTALSIAPVADASLLAYFWPVLIVLFSTFLPNEQLKWFHILGAFTALLGAVFLIAGDGEFSFSAQYIVGYVAAISSAIIWALYSILNRTIPNVPTNIVAGYCIATALLGGISHIFLEQWVTPEYGQWLAIIGLGIGPVGAAFYAWDYATKRGNIRMLGILSYSAPVLSTVFLILAEKAEISWGLVIACILITSGACIASLDFFKQKIYNPNDDQK